MIDLQQVYLILHDAFMDVLSTILIMIIIWFKNVIFDGLFVIYYYITVKLKKQPIILIWNDDDISISEKLCNNLSRLLPEYRFKSLHSPVEIIKYPQSPKIIKSIILIVSDVTKLSEDPKKREKIQNWLREYVRKGGGIIGTHDIVYRRVRNKILEEVFGGKINDFQRIPKVTYVRNPEIPRHHVIFSDLPDKFELEDGEIVWGTWKPDSIVAFTIPGSNPKPLVVLREYSSGRVVWINSADKKEHIGNSIHKPQKEFLILLRNAILWSTRRDNDEGMDFESST